MALEITDYFEYNKELGVYDFTKESPKIHALRSIVSSKSFKVNNLPLTIIAFREYGDHTLWWVLAAHNNIIEVDNIQQEYINIPNLKDVKRALK
jgi:hypothetical protein